jgi:hypothetical protein
MVVGIAPISTSLKLIGIGTMKEEIAALKDRITDLKEKLQEIRGYL